MAYTLSQLRTLLSRYGFDESDPLDLWINAALTQIVDEDDFGWTFLEDVYNFTLPAFTYTGVELDVDIVKPKALRDITHEQDPITNHNRGGFPLAYKSYGEWNLIRNMRSTGRPYLFTLEGEFPKQRLHLWPVTTEDRDYRLLYIKKIPQLVNPSDVPAIPESFHYPIVTLAASIALMAENEEDRAGTALAQYEQSLERLRAKYGSRQFSDFEQVVQVED